MAEVPRAPGDLRGRIHTPSRRVFVVRGATLYEQGADGALLACGTLATDSGEVRFREGERQGELGLLIEDRLTRYSYSYVTQVFTVLQSVSRIRVRWQYAPALGPAVAFRVYRQVTVDGMAFVKIAEVSPVDAGPQTYTYLDTQIQPGLTYSYYVVAVTETGEESVATTTMTVEVPRSLQAPQNAIAVFVDGS